ncbi:hypothetical protein CCHR01_10714 [Colletotrichum chrysophilum]|uniref:Secreted protein n=1 Tax=Colletotrichum chrysophilum TaxID=1836956 RepID=A0AAD9EJ48_9PEZI|nr:hypothetical protein CCHR01_10714 [Colletotrichum chrysophilum]
MVYFPCLNLLWSASPACLYCICIRGFMLPDPVQDWCLLYPFAPHPCLIQTEGAPPRQGTFLPSLSFHTTIHAATVRLDARCRGLLPTTKTRPDGLVVQRRRGAIVAYWPPKPKVAGASPVVGAFFDFFVLLFTF